MALIGISDAMARHLVSQQGQATDDIRAGLKGVGAYVDSLTQANYISGTTKALHTKFYDETMPKFQKLINHHDETREGTIKAIDIQSATDDNHVGGIQSI